MRRGAGKAAAWERRCPYSVLYVASARPPSAVYVLSNEAQEAVHEAASGG